MDETPAIEARQLRKTYLSTRGVFRREGGYLLLRLLESWARRGGLQEAY
jgi:hypothetical protein